MQHDSGKPHWNFYNEMGFMSNPILGIGGAPMRATVLPDAAGERKKFPVASGLLDYFPDALAVVANVSYVGNEQHNPGKPLNWDRSKSGDEADTMLRHFLQRGMLDKDGIRHSAKMAWRALALLQKELEQEKEKDDYTWWIKAWKAYNAHESKKITEPGVHCPRCGESVCRCDG